MKIAFERGIRESLCPVRSKATSNKFFHCTSLSKNRPPRLKTDHLMILNIVHDLIINKHFKTDEGGMIPRKWKTSEVLNQLAPFGGSNIEQQFNDLNLNPSPNYTGSIRSFKELVEEYKFLKEVPWDKDRRARRFAEILRDLNSLVFNLSLKVRWVYTEQISWVTNKGLKQFKQVPHCETLRFNNHFKTASHLIRFPLIEEVEGNKGVNDVRFQINLGHPFSIMAIQGLMFINVDWIPEQVYTTKMSDSSKFLFITTFAGTRKEYNFTLDDMINKLSLNPRRPRTNLSYDVEFHLKELVNNKFIKEVTTEGKSYNRRYKIIKK